MVSIEGLFACQVNKLMYTDNRVVEFRRNIEATRHTILLLMNLLIIVNKPITIFWSKFRCMATPSLNILQGEIGVYVM